MPESRNGRNLRGDSAGKLVEGEGNIGQKRKSGEVRGKSAGEVKGREVEGDDVAAVVAGDSGPGTVAGAGVPEGEAGNGGFEGEEGLVFGYESREGRAKVKL